jgi:hypothetical protein
LNPAIHLRLFSASEQFRIVGVRGGLRPQARLLPARSSTLMMILLGAALDADHFAGPRALHSLLCVVPSQSLKTEIVALLRIGAA